MKYPKPTDRYSCEVLCENFMEIEERLTELEENGGGATIEVDSELSTESTNPVQNKVIAEQLDNRYTKNEVDAMFGSYVDDVAELLGV